MSLKNTFFNFFLVIVLVFVVFSALYIKIAEQQNQIFDLQTEVIVQQNNLDRMEQMQEEPAVVEQRVVIPRGQVNQFIPELPILLNENGVAVLTPNNFLLPPSESVVYKNRAKGIQFSLPYNPEWGAPEYRLNPYDEDVDGVSFGSILQGAEGGNIWTEGTVRLDFVPTSTQAELIAELESESKSEEIEYDITTHTINGKQVVEYTKLGLCQGGRTVILGEKHNYQLTDLCSSAFYEELIETMEFVQ